MKDPSGHFQRLEGSLLASANEGYAAIGFTPSDPLKDRTFGLLDGDRILALGRLQGQAGVLEVGGFWVDEDRRGQGLARRMVDHVLQQIEPGVHAWCIPFEPLLGFYRSFGMIPAEPDQAPEVIRTKLEFCAAQHAAGIYAWPTSLLRYERAP